MLKTDALKAFPVHSKQKENKKILVPYFSSPFNRLYPATATMIGIYWYID